MRTLKIRFEPEAAQEVQEAIRAAGLPGPIIERLPGGAVILRFTNDVDEAATRNAVKAGLSAYRLRGVGAFDPLGLHALTPQQVSDYIDAQVVDLQSAKAIIKRLAVLTLYLYKRELMEV